MINKLTKKSIFDNENSRSIANELRKKRNLLFRSLLILESEPLRILDVGGTEKYWFSTGLLDDPVLSTRIKEIVVFNIKLIETSSPKIKSVVGDAKCMEFDDKEFDVIFSNSVIEHLENYEDQKRMASEIMRVGKKYFVQTPNRNFPIEPHFVFPFFQFLPIYIRVWLITHFALGWYGRVSTPEYALELVKEIRLLTKREFTNLFPDAEIFEERFVGLTKSFIAFAGWK